MSEERRAPRLAAHLVLVGLPGAGKSSVGRAVAARLRRPFLDFDREIERREGRSVRAIFAAHGERYFRDRERELTEEVRRRDPAVLAPGGGWITNPDLVALLRPPARIVYLSVRPETALARMGERRAGRPLLAGADPLTELRRLLEAREAQYLLADDVVDTEGIAVQQLAEMVAELVSAPGTT